MRKTVTSATELAITALIIINVAAFALLFTLRDPGLYSVRAELLSIPSGYLIDQSFMAPQAAPCALIRLSSDGCRYCRIDRTEYTRLAQEIRDRGCMSLIL